MILRAGSLKNCDFAGDVLQQWQGQLHFLIILITSSHLEASWAHFGDILGYLGLILGSSWAILGLSWAGKYLHMSALPVPMLRQV